MFYLNPVWKTRERLRLIWIAFMTAILLAALVAVPALADGRQQVAYFQPV